MYITIELEVIRYSEKHLNLNFYLVDPVPQKCYNLIVKILSSFLLQLVCWLGWQSTALVLQRSGFKSCTGLIFFQALLSLLFKQFLLLRRSRSCSFLKKHYTYMIFIYSQSLVCNLMSLSLLILFLKCQENQDRKQRSRKRLLVNRAQAFILARIYQQVT